MDDLHQLYPLVPNVQHIFVGKKQQPYHAFFLRHIWASPNLKSKDIKVKVNVKWLKLVIYTPSIDSSNKNFFKCGMYIEVPEGVLQCIE